MEIFTYEFLNDLRKLLKITVNELAEYFGWSNTKHYYKIKKQSNPTINYIFGGVNYAFENYPQIFEPYKEKILELIKEHFLFNLM